MYTLEAKQLINKWNVTKIPGIFLYVVIEMEARA
jgi:hypothetical protein